MPSFTFLTSSDSTLGIYADGQPAGSARDYLRAHPEHLDPLADALLAHLVAQRNAELASLQTQLASAQAALDQMRATYEPPPAPPNLIVIELPEPSQGATHVGITGYSKGLWQGDLLKQAGENQYTLVAEDGIQFPASESVTSLPELTGPQIEADLAAYQASGVPPPS
jgi:hypothetical protein